MMEHIAHCAVCGAPIRHKKTAVCYSCYRELRDSKIQKYVKAFCTSCGMPLLAGESSCPRCRLSTIECIGPVFSIFCYSGIVKECIALYKFHGVSDLSTVFSRFLLEAIGEVDIPSPVLIPVPCSAISLKRRGWDQMLLITDQLKKSGVDICPILKHSGNDREQKRLNRRSRISSSQTRFTLDVNLTEQIEKRNIIVVDDVLTTGATINACIKLCSLLETGQIVGLTIVMD